MEHGGKFVPAAADTLQKGVQRHGVSGGKGEVRPRGSMWREREEAGVGHGGFGQLGWSGRGLAEMPMGGVRACIQRTMRSDRAAGADRWAHAIAQYIVGWGKQGADMWAPGTVSGSNHQPGQNRSNPIEVKFQTNSIFD
jgi:hypothetical protein